MSLFKRQIGCTIPGFFTDIQITNALDSDNDNCKKTWHPATQFGSPYLMILEPEPAVISVHTYSEVRVDKRENYGHNQWLP
jgi:hypothetical protein